MVVSAGIDVGKASCCVALRHQDGSYLEKSFPNSPKGAQECISFFKKTGVSEETPVVLESTGGYHLLFAMTIKDAHFRGIKVINAILTKKYQKSKIRKTKTDSVDAKMLARMALMEELPSFIQTKKEVAQKKRMSLLRQLKKAQQRLTGSLKNCLETCKNLEIEINTDGFEKALKTIAVEIENLEKEITDNQKSPLAQELAKMQGVSAVSAAIIVSFLEGKTFDSKEKLVAFTGLDLTVRESGTSVHGKRHLSKRGDSFLRLKLFQIAWALKMHDKHYKDYYLKKRAEKKNYSTCLIAVARKFVHHIYAIQKKLQENNLSSPQLNVFA